MRIPSVRTDIMVLYIGINGQENETYAKKLCKFFMKKQYKTRLVLTPTIFDTKYILDNPNLTSHQKILLLAFDRSFEYYNTNWENYDIVIWNNSIIHDYLEYNNTIFTRQCNKYFPQMDLNIVIGNYDVTGFKEKVVQIPNTTPDKTFNNIVQTCFDNLPKCNWCPRLFKPNKKLKKYCSEKCREASLEEQYRINNRRYYHRYKDVMTEKQKGALGSKNANLHGRADPNPLSELEKVRNAKRALGLKSLQDHIQ